MLSVEHRVLFGDGMPAVEKLVRRQSGSTDTTLGGLTSDCGWQCGNGSPFAAHPLLECKVPHHRGGEMPLQRR
eukprot:198915-Rhodomonas_salina.2